MLLTETEDLGFFIIIELDEIQRENSANVCCNLDDTLVSILGIPDPQRITILDPVNVGAVRVRFECGMA